MKRLERVNHMATIFDEIEATKRLIRDTRDMMHCLGVTQRVYGEKIPDSVQIDSLLRDKQIIVKGLELYLDALESTVSAHDRIERREKKLPYHGRNTNTEHEGDE